MEREFQKGDIVKELGMRIKCVVVDIHKMVDRIKVKPLEGDMKGVEEWKDIFEYDFWKKD